MVMSARLTPRAGKPPRCSSVAIIKFQSETKPEAFQMPWISDFVLRDVPAIPGRLYHYTSQPGLLGILRTKTIWSARIQFLNDSREFVHTLGLWKRTIETAIGELGTEPEKTVPQMCSGHCTRA